MTEPAVWRVNPYVTRAGDAFYNPHADATLGPGQAGYLPLERMIAGDGVSAADDPALQELATARWLVAPGEDPDRWYRLRFVSIEAHTACNQACSFCPVSVAPRAAFEMPAALFSNIVRQVAELGEPVEGVFLNGYNEPTLDRRLVQQVATLNEHGLRAALLTNGTGLTPARVDGLIASGGLGYLAINLSTTDHDRYWRERTVDHVALVMRHLEYLRDRPIAELMDIVVLGNGDDEHAENHATIERHFEGSRFRVRRFVANDRAGYFRTTSAPAQALQPLRGCDQMGSRPIQHLHVDPYGRCLLCCQDYDGDEVVGDLNSQSVREVLAGPALARARRRAYGLEETPDDFICHGCAFALH